MTSWGPPIETVRELLRATASGGKLVFTPPQKLRHENQWHPYRIVGRDQVERAVRTSVAIAAYRRGLVKVRHE